MIAIGKEFKRRSSPDCVASRTMLAIVRLFWFVVIVEAAGLADAEMLSVPGCTVMVLSVIVVLGSEALLPEF